MQGQEAIINKIIADAEINAKGTLDDAQAHVDNIVTASAEQSKDYVYKVKAEQDQLRDDIASRSATVAHLDAKKLMLRAKNELIVRTFKSALDKVRELDKKSYEKLIFGMLELAEDGDVVTISPREKDILTAEKLAQFAAKKKIKLTLNKSLGEFDGGIVLTGGGVDKNLTFETEIELLRDEKETEIAGALFKE